MAKRGRPLGSSKKTAQVQNKYDAAGNGRRMRGWNPSASGPNKAITGLQNIRNRSRDAGRNDWSGESAAQKWTTTLIGVGIVPRFNRIKNPVRKQEVTDLHNDFVAQSDADGVLNLYGQQTLAVRSWFESGEVFARKRARRPDAGFAVPMQVQLIEADFVPLLDADTWPGLLTGNRIRSGIELTISNRRVAYWVYKEHPGDGVMGNLSNVSTTLLVRIPAEDMLHIFFPTRPGQLRGVPAMAPVLAKLRSINDYDDTVLERQKLANLFVGFITRTMGGSGDPEADPLTGMPIEGSMSAPLVGLQPGIMQELDNGEDVKWSNPPEAGTMYHEYMRTQNMTTAAAAGMPYELMSGDIRQVSDRTLRVLMNEFRRLAEQRQWQVVIPMFCKPIMTWFAEAAFLAGKIEQSEIVYVRNAEHSPHGWAYIHPVQDVQGKALEVSSGFRSRASVVGERGDDIETVDQERASDSAREARLGLSPAGQPVAQKIKPKKPVKSETVGKP